ncbi:Hypothetical predicted protein [Olea europaea subsp. europaea]|uniref:Secreted protein n=1 Tax=Olea europaea subsp. europaea TaxID=158383 RepID=A0A8S0S2F1_OLEEU|nr:Hypothetical predicted protein [Olea europaea subsp. europaea]
MDAPIVTARLCLASILVDLWQGNDGFGFVCWSDGDGNDGGDLICWWRVGSGSTGCGGDGGDRGGIETATTMRWRDDGNCGMLACHHHGGEVVVVFDSHNLALALALVVTI